MLIVFCLGEHIENGFKEPWVIEREREQPLCQNTERERERERERATYKQNVHVSQTQLDGKLKMTDREWNEHI
jgi:hypothetical protein